jgi:hypothetical protein
MPLSSRPSATVSNRALVHTAMLAESSASTAYTDSIYAGRLGERRSQLSSADMTKLRQSEVGRGGRDERSRHGSETVQAMTTEHFVLQAARSATIQEANKRATLFLTSVSCATIALAFVAQVTQMSRPFVLFSPILLPCLYFIFYGPGHFRARQAGRYRGYGARARHGVNTTSTSRPSCDVI